MKRAAICAVIALSCLAAVPGVLAQDGQATSPNGVIEGAALFLEECGICHLEGGTGTMMLARRLGEDKALIAQRTDLPPQYVETVVRRGINSMPSITRVELPDAELQAIIDYLAKGPTEAKAVAGRQERPK